MMEPLPNVIHMKEHIVDFMRFDEQEEINLYELSNWEISHGWNSTRNRFLVHLAGYIASKLVESELLPDEHESKVNVKSYRNFPSTAWDHVKQRCKELMPTLCKRMKVCTERVAIEHRQEITVKRVSNTYCLCPHTPKPAGQNHLRWLEYGEMPVGRIN